MNLHYVKNELWHQRRRTISAVVGLTIGVALMIIINSLASAYRQAARAPLSEIGADITVQRSGNVPKEMAGPVFPCSAVTLRDDEIKRIAAMPGVIGIGKALLLWVFDPRQAWIVLGIEQHNSIGPATLRSAISAGRFLGENGSEALVESAFADRFGIKVGDTLSLAGRHFKVVGLVDASRSAKIAVANVYIALNDAQKLAVSSPLVQSVSPFKEQDVNLLFIRADQRRISELSAQIRNLLGKQGNISSSDSFMKLLGGVFAIFDRFAVIASLIAFLVCGLVSLKIMAGNINERARDIGILKAVGWTDKDVMSQIVAESLVQGLMGGLLGILIATVTAFCLSFIKIEIPIPWDMSPAPHFLPGGDKQLFKTIPLLVTVSWQLALMSIFLSVAVGGITGGLLARVVSRIKPAEVLRHE
jgi:lipoprotein-releasing system permease protein